jgi:cytochrome P450
MAPIEPPAGRFLAAVEAAEQSTPLPPPPPPAPDQNDPRYLRDPRAYERDRLAVEQTRANFAAAARLRGGAIGQLISDRLKNAPLAMLQELLDAPADQVPIFAPVIGPAIVARRQYVLTCLTRDDLFTVEPYAAKMARGMDDPARASGAFSHFLLSTDDEALYRPDDVLLRSVITSDDADRLTRTTRTEAERWASRLRDAGELDVVNTLARTVPLRIVGNYLGVPWSDQDTPAPLPGLRGGDTFPLDDDLVKVFTFNRITAGVVPTEEQLFDWIKDVFRDVFNNFGPPTRQSVDFTERGLEATEYLTAYIHALLIHYRSQLREGGDVPDTMLTRLLRLQLRVAAEGDERLRAALGPALPPGTAAARLSDSMIRSNVLGTVVGAVVNPQEATARIVDSLLRLQDGEYPVRNGSSFSAAVAAARTDEDAPGYAESLRTVRRYSLEALRLRPQGEVLLRRCVRDNTELGGVLIRAGTLVFVAYAGAMRDPMDVPEPSAFDADRDPQPYGYLRTTDRAREAEQSQLYLQHGFGRHKCLGRYVSEITMQESARALLRLGGLARLSELEMDEQNLYAVRLRIGVGEDPR